MERRFAKDEAVVEREIRGEHLLIPVTGSMEALDSLYALNEVAGFIWRQACDGVSEEEIARNLAREYDVTAATAMADVQRVTNELLAIRALKAVPADKPQS